LAKRIKAHIHSIYAISYYDGCHDRILQYPQTNQAKEPDNTSANFELS